MFLSLFYYILLFAILGTYYRLGLFILRKSLSLFFPVGVLHLFLHEFVFPVSTAGLQV